MQVTAARIVCSCVKGDWSKSFAMRELTVAGRVPYAAKKPHSVAGSAKKWANLFKELQMFEGIQGGNSPGFTGLRWFFGRFVERGNCFRVDKC